MTKRCPKTGAGNSSRRKVENELNAAVHEGNTIKFEAMNMNHIDRLLVSSVYLSQKKYIACEKIGEKFHILSVYG
jgi:hypothetical protein